MGIQDFDSIFHILDPARRGVINAEQVKQIDATLHFTPLDDPQVRDHSLIMSWSGSAGILGPFINYVLGWVGDLHR